jgi:hypothetical protein
MKSTSILDKIAALNLEPIKNKLMDPESGEGWSRAKVEAMDLEYRRFLHLMHAFPNQSASPTKAVDTFWHYHILDTQRYAADCDHVFGCFMHHDPYGEPQQAADGSEAGVDSGERTREMYEATFGEAYIRPEAYFLDLPADGMATAPGMAGGLAGTTAAACDASPIRQAKPAGAKNAVCQVVCHSFCMMKAKPAAAKNAVCQVVCHSFCMMKAKGAAQETAGHTLARERPDTSSASAC